MQTSLIVILILCSALLLEIPIFYLVLICPKTSRKAELRPYEGLVAHRGLFNLSDAPENTLAAFKRAVEAGLPIELDVRLTKDGRLVVFHDDNLWRMVGVDKRVADCDYEELSALCVGSSRERIPLFSDVLSLVDAKVPMIVEIKVEADYLATTEALRDHMRGYRGLYCVESFNPLALVWYKKNCPDVLRGQLATDLFREENKYSFFYRLVLSNLLLNVAAKPDFIAYDHRYAKKLSLRLCRGLFGAETAAWTIRSQAELDRAKKHFPIRIFDSFVPEELLLGD